VRLEDGKIQDNTSTNLSQNITTLNTFPRLNNKEIYLLRIIMCFIERSEPDILIILLMESSFGFTGKDFVILAADANASFRVFNLKVARLSHLARPPKTRYTNSMTPLLWLVPVTHPIV